MTTAHERIKSVRATGENMTEAEAEAGLRKMADEVADPLGGVLRSLFNMLDDERQKATKAQGVIEAARGAACDTGHIPACVELGKAIYEYDKARGALCPSCDGAGSIDDDECDRGEGPTCEACNGTGLTK